VSGVETIAAIATPAGAGGIGIIRISGPRAVAIAAALIGRSPDELPERTLVHGEVRGDDEQLDEVLVVAMRAPHSYTGDDVAEVHAHGGAVNMAQLLRLVLGRGARPAEPGEFTRRAFETGRLDLTRAEAVVAVIEAASERALRVAQAQLRGSVGDAVTALRAGGIDVLAEVEASVDFPGEDLDFAPATEIGERAETLAAEVARLAQTFTYGRALREGVSVVLVGPVNAGKSSLFNALVGSERAVVTAEPGTTRDFVEARVVWDGVQVTLIDTAGEREATSEAERLGIELSRSRAETADLRVVLHVAGGAAVTAPPVERELHITSKADLAEPRAGGLLATSAVDGRGLDGLRAAILAAAVGRASDGDDGIVVTSVRQSSLLEAAARAWRAAGRAALEGQPAEILALELRAGVDALSEVVGERVDDDVLDVLFARFCIGK